MIPSSINNNLKLQSEKNTYCLDTTKDNYIHKVEEINNLLEASLFSTNEVDIEVEDDFIPGKSIDPNRIQNDKPYYYQAIECLNTDINEMYNCIDGARVHICLYNINTNAKHPFLEFSLVKNKHSDVYPDIMCFPTFFYYKDLNIDILRESEKMQKTYLIATDESTFKGFLLEETNSLHDLYLFYEYHVNDINGRGQLHRNNVIWKVVIDEIINTRLVCNFPIDDIVTFFFMKNMQFMFLYKYADKNNNIIYETPTVVYHGVNESMLYFKYIFGITKSNHDAIMGPFYYFTDYKNAVKMSIDNTLSNANTNTNKKLGIIRSVIFLGVSKVPMNYPEDEADDSQYSSNIIADNNENAQINRITDHDGIWSYNYDSVYIGKLLLDNGKFIKDTPLWVVKNYDQQTSLSYHYLSSKLLNDEWSEDKQYYIL
jgi:hypothetical protein